MQTEIGRREKLHFERVCGDFVRHHAFVFAEVLGSGLEYRERAAVDVVGDVRLVGDVEHFAPFLLTRRLLVVVVPGVGQGGVGVRYRFHCECHRIWKVSSNVFRLHDDHRFLYRQP